MNTVPVALIVFNRPEVTRQVLNAIAAAKPAKLFIIADGPRPDVPTDQNACNQTRRIVSQIKWDCQVYRNYSDVNLGCRKRVATGLDWVFSQVESAIILEDDCLPEPSFFQFCHELLDRYRDDTRIMTISGDNFQFGRRRTQDSYYFSRYPHCWGWATWRRAWQYNDVTMSLWPQVREEDWLRDILGNRSAVHYWQHKFQQTYDGVINTWDYGWTLACWLQSGLCILPNHNLVSNIGFEAQGTHHTHSYSPFAAMSTQAIKFPLRHPAMVLRNGQADDFTQAYQFGLWARGWRKLRSLLKL